MVQEANLKPVLALTDELLHILTSLGISPRKQQVEQTIPELLLNPPAIDEELRTLGLSEDLSKRLNTTYNSACSELALRFREAFSKVASERIPSQYMSISSVAIRLQDRYTLAAQQIRSRVLNAVHQHQQDTPQQKLQQRQELQQQQDQHQQNSIERFFTDEAKDVLETAFEEDNHPNMAARRRLAVECNLELKQVTTWFANKRARKNKSRSKRSYRRRSSNSETVSSAEDRSPSPVPSLSSSISSRSSSSSFTAPTDFQIDHDDIVITPATPQKDAPFTLPMFTQQPTFQQPMFQQDASFQLPEQAQPFDISSLGQLESAQSFDPAFWESMIESMGPLSNDAIQNSLFPVAPPSLDVLSSNDMDLGAFLNTMEMDTSMDI